MRYQISFALICLTLLVLLLAPSSTEGQGKKGLGGGGFGGPGGFGGNRDPNQAFDFLAKGRTYFLVTESNRLREPLSLFLQQQGITNGQVTRELFAAFNDRVAAAMGNMGGGPRGFGGPSGLQGPGGFSGPGSFQGSGFQGSGFQGSGFQGFQAPGMQNPIDTLNQWAEADFKRLDRNGDGFLNQDEMPDQLRAELSKWDSNRDNLVSIDEYKVYFAARMQTRGRFGSQQPNPVTILLEDEDLDVRPVVYRAGKVPAKELPSWFVEMDTDKDGQVALYEWRKAGKDVDEFRQWDRNNDGFITVEEAMYKHRLTQIASANSESEDADATEAPVRTGKGSNLGNSGGEDRGFKGKGKGKGKKGGPQRD